MITLSLIATMASAHVHVPLKPRYVAEAPIRYKNLAIFPVRLVDESGLSKLTSSSKRYITLDEGLKTGTVTVKEIGSETPLVRNRSASSSSQAATQRAQTVRQQGTAGASVNELALVNRSGKTLILIAGEMVVGGKQDRIIQKDGLILSNSKPTSLEVFCVEHGRWGSSQGAFKPNSAPLGGGGGAVADPAVRGAAQSGKGQGAVWKEVDAKNAKSGATAQSQTYSVTLNSKKNLESSKDYLAAIESKFPKKGAAGAIVSVNGRLIWADYFGSDELFDRYRTKLLRSYIVEAVTEYVPSSAYDHPSVARAQSFVDDLAGSWSFSGVPDVFALQRLDGKGQVVHVLADQTDKTMEFMVHFNKMLVK